MDIYKLNFTITELELFSFLSLRAGEQFSQRELAKEIHVSPTAIGKSIKKLHEKKLIQLIKMKTINLISFNRDNRKAIQLKKIENLKQLYQSELIEFLEEKLAGATIILFGSYAKGEDTKNSDIDLAIIGRKEKTINCKIFEKKLARDININFYNSLEEIHIHLKNNILNGITLSGTIELQEND
jgi:predicted nucleotidyltransferase/predicted DNA-binding protein (UPF0251 family)